MSAEYFTLDKIVRTLLVKRGETSDHKKYLWLTFAKSFLDLLTQVKPKVARQVKTVRLEVGADRTIPYPEGYLTYTKLGVQVRDKVIVLAFNPHLSNLPACANTPSFDVNAYGNFAGIPSSVLATSDVRYPFVGYLNSFGERTGQLYGYGNGGFTGHFSANDECREFRFNTENNITTVYLEYVSYDLEASAEMVLDARVVGALEYFVLWQAELMKNNFGAAQVFEQKYQDAFMLMHALSDDYGTEEHAIVIEECYSMLPNV